MPDFHLIDLVSQREAVRSHLNGYSVADVVRWLAAKGKVSKVDIFDRETFVFESAVGLQAIFFFDANEMVFVGDNTTFRC